MSKTLIIWKIVKPVLGQEMSTSVISYLTKKYKITKLPPEMWIAPINYYYKTPINKTVFA